MPTLRATSIQSTTRQPVRPRSRVRACRPGGAGSLAWREERVEGDASLMRGLEFNLVARRRGEGGVCSEEQAQSQQQRRET